jgi:hypothetical protein
MRKEYEGMKNIRKTPGGSAKSANYKRALFQGPPFKPPPLAVVVDFLRQPPMR